MKLSKAYWQTYKEIPSDAEIPSHQLMMRAGLIHKTAAGLYTYLPMANRSLSKIQNIIREELDKIDCQEVLMSVITPGELWKESGRWETMGPQMLKIEDRAKRDLCVSPTNEETVTDLFRKTITSYKQLPLCLYQINTKFRDEIRPRFGLMRAREFLMKDGYSFHLDSQCLDEFYEKIYQAYENIFKRMGLEFIVVEADGGAMASGEAKTHEFQLIADNGEDTVITAPEKDYAANIEKAATRRVQENKLPATDLKEFETPTQKTCEEVAKAFDFQIEQTLKSIVMVSEVEGEKSYYLCLLIGDDSLNEIKFNKFVKNNNTRAASQSEIAQIGLVKGFIGPVGIKNVTVVLDESIDQDSSYVVGANKPGFHFSGFVPSRDSQDAQIADLRLAKAGDTYEGEPIVMKKGIEVGHVFQLGDKYTQSMNAQVLNKEGKKVTPLMGCYGIGVSRILAATIEQCHDENGIIWPKALAPYEVYFAVIGKSDETKALSLEIYQELKKAGVEVVLDDRGMGPGAMFKDADLLGLPLRLLLGERDYQASGEFELVVRKSGEKIKVKKEKLVQLVKAQLESL